MRLTGSFVLTVGALAALVFPAVMGECKHPNDPCIEDNKGKTRCVCGDATNKRQLTCNGEKWKPNGGCKKKYCNCNKCEFLSNIPTNREGNPAWGDCLW
ncbi:hypothetical protein NU195Hw_Modified_20t1 [Hortaea werneckii]